MVRSLLVRGQPILEKGQTKILGPTSVIWDQSSEIWPHKVQAGNPALDPSETIMDFSQQ